MRYLRQNTATQVTVGPFLDKTDGITPEVALTVTSEKLTFVVDDAGVPTLVLDVAPTASGGANDMVHITNDDSGFYDLELAAANVNYVGRAMLSLNDVATHCPVFHEFMIVPANVYDSMFGTDLLDVSVVQLLGTAWLTPATAGTPDVNAKLVGATAQTGRDLGASVLLSSGTGTGQLDFTSGVVKANATQILGTAVSTPATAGILDVNLKNIANAAVATGSAQLGVNVVTQANIDFGALQKTSLNAATPASVVGAVGSVTGAVGSVTGNVGGSVASVTGAVGSVTGNVGGNVTGSVGSVAATVAANLTQILGTAITETVPGYIALAFKKVFDVLNATWTALSVNQTGDAFGRLGAPAGASVSADVAAMKVDTAAILVDTAEIGTAGAGLTALATQASVNTIDGIVDSILTDTAEIGTAGAGLTAVVLATPPPTALQILAQALAAESYAADAGTPTLSQILWMIWAGLVDFSITGTTLTVKKQDGTAAMTFTLDDATNPTSRTRAT